MENSKGRIKNLLNDTKNEAMDKRSMMKMLMVVDKALRAMKSTDAEDVRNPLGIAMKRLKELK